MSSEDFANLTYENKEIDLDEIIVGNDYKIGKFKFNIFIQIHFKGKTIGEGTFGKVKLGFHILTGEKVKFKNY